MKQPKFKFGEEFYFEGYAEFKGSRHKVTSKLRIVQITMLESNHDITYQYKLSNLLPNEYGEAHFDTYGELALEKMRDADTSKKS